MLLERRTVGASLALVALAALAGVAVWPRLPAEMAIHFSASGTPDSYVSKEVGVALVPAIMLATLLLIEGAMRVDPPADSRTADAVTVATMAFVAAVHGIVLAWNLGYAVDFGAVLVGALLWAGAVCAYAIRREHGVAA